MTSTANPESRHALVLGCGDVGSAVAHSLHRSGLRVLLCDLERPAHARRGMAFTDALFDGSATLQGVTARRAESVDDIEACWSKLDAIPVSSRPEGEWLRLMRFDIAIEATMRRRQEPLDMRSWAVLTIGLGPGFTAGRNCHVAIETGWGDAMGTVLRGGSTAERTGGPKALDGIGRERFVAAPFTGRWHSDAVIGQPVRSSDVIGQLGDTAIISPIDGTLRGVTHDGVEVRAGQKILEVDPRDSPQVFGIGERPAAIAKGVAAALGLAPSCVTM